MSLNNEILAYKVAKRLVGSDTIFTSAFASGAGILVYELQKEVIVPDWLKERELYPLLFSHLRLAREWMDLLVVSDFAILVCECKFPIPLKNKLSLHNLQMRRIVKDNYVTEFPFGTVSYKQVIPQYIAR